jgi:enterochelin esterase-like enzyme
MCEWPADPERYPCWARCAYVPLLRAPGARVPAEPIPKVAAAAEVARGDDATAVFRIPDPARRLGGVRLRTDVPIAGDLLDFRRNDDGWQLVIDRPPVSRMEYLVELRHLDGRGEIVTDPGNPRQAAGAFGPKSVLEFPSYTLPGWLTTQAEPGNCRSFEVPVPSLDGAISVRTWSPAGVPDDEPLPLLVAHDGPEYDALAGLTSYLAAGVAGKWLPPLRAALLGPGHRDRWYSANARYARALRLAVIPALAGRLATSVRVGMGASLGGLAMLHTHRRHPDAFDALFLQSGSFFCPLFDQQERRFPYYRRIVRFVADVHSGGPPARRVPVVLTCGVIEENAENNRLMAQALRTHGYRATLHEVADMHNYTAWRDAFDPHLTRLLRQMCP